ncbi:MAG: Mrp/NBP35 family ATP-binding protein [Oscillospiraceae bacterium]|nr:Mrp/NBP35 family ATP-binding protein [Oscillospiraceae bacterium]
MAECNHDCANCSANCSSRTSPQDLIAPLNPCSSVKHVIAVVSGKGGVGKSMVTSSLATAMARLGKKVGILDADITGPSIPKAFGLTGPLMGCEAGIIPGETPKGMKVMSLNLLTENDTDPVVWRGPVIAGCVKQFWSDTYWGDLDYMFIDMPPGTGDVPLTVFQSIPVDGIVVVTSPQDLVSMIVTKALKMAQLMNIPVLGLVENFSYFQCPDCGKRHHIYGESKIAEVAAENKVIVLAQLPIDPSLAASCDAGKMEEHEANYLAETALYLEGQLG